MCKKNDGKRNIMERFCWGKESREIFWRSIAIEGIMQPKTNEKKMGTQHKRNIEDGKNYEEFINEESKGAKN